jgi:hypothetical protein
MHEVFYLERLKGRDHFGEPTHRWNGTIKMDIKRNIMGRLNWIHLVLNRVQQWALENMVTKFGIRKRQGI